MSKKSKFISVLIALVLAFSMLFIFNITAIAGSVTIGSGSSLFTNTKNIEIEGTDNGLALRLLQKEFAYTEWSKTLPMNNFEIQFKINDDNFDKVEFNFYSAYNLKDSNNYDLDGIVSPTIEDKRNLIQPQMVLNKITVEKTASGKLKAVLTNSKGESETLTSNIDFLNSTVTIKYNSTVGSEEFRITVSSGSNSESKGKETVRLINDEANLRIDFPEDSIKRIAKPIKQDKDDDIPAQKTLLIEKIAYDYNITSDPQRFTQEFKGETVEDKSHPILKADKKLLSNDGETPITGDITDPVYVPVYTQFKIPVYGLDIIHSLSSLSISATVKYFKSQTDYDAYLADKTKTDLYTSVTVNSLAFQVDKTSGFYVIEKITINDGTYSLNFGVKPSGAGASEIWYDKIDNEIKMPIVVQGVERMDSSEFAFNINQDYADLFKGILLKGGPRNSIKFPMPHAANGSFDEATETGIKSYLGTEKENPYNITYYIYYQHENDSAHNWTKNSKAGLEFNATRTGKYKFKIEAIDRQGNIKLCDTIIELTFIDTERPELSVSYFPDERIINEQFNIPTASTTDDFDNSPTKAMKLYFFNEEEKWEQIKISGTNFTPDKLGEYKVIYTAFDNEGNNAISIERTFTVVEPPESKRESVFELSTLSIVFLVIAGVALMGIAALLFIKPKEKVE